MSSYTKVSQVELEEFRKAHRILVDTSQRLDCRLEHVPLEVARLKSEIIRLNSYIAQLLRAVSGQEDY